MTPKRFTSRLPARRAALIVLLAAAALSAHAEVQFTGVADKDRVTLSCEGQAVLDTSCRLRVGESENIAVRFSKERTRYAPLLKDGIEKALEIKQGSRRLSESDAPLLRALALNQCHPADEAHGMSGDVLQLCVTAEPSTRIVLFVRGLCDHCEFEPLILQRQASAP